MRSALALCSARRIWSACSWSTQKTIVFAHRSVRLRYSVRCVAAASVRVSSETTRSKSLVVYRPSGISLPNRSSWPSVGRPAVRVGAQDDPAHPVGREEAVLDALCERVLEERVAEVVVAVDGLVALRGRGHAELRRRREVLEDALATTTRPRALPRWHSSTITRSKKSGANSRNMPSGSSPLSASCW